mmetsp:Transcript_15928/g.30830  ORF Transcript_15928/g.30830 Transcript_15928/m.30830 type:complete len:270 (-) Transcript_15928:1239-2048(-)
MTTAANFEILCSTVLMASMVASAFSWAPRKSSPRPTQSIFAMGWSSSAGEASIRRCTIDVHTSSSEVPAKTRPSARPARATTSMLADAEVSATTGMSTSATSSFGLPAWAIPRPRAALMRIMSGLPSSKCSGRRLNAGSTSSRTPQFTIPSASRAPALMGSELYKYLSICDIPSFTFQRRIIPREAAALIMPCSLFLYNHLLSAGVISASFWKPTLTKAFTKVEARFWRADSTWAASLRREFDSERWLLYTSSGVLASSALSSRARLWK